MAMVLFHALLVGANLCTLVGSVRLTEKFVAKVIQKGQTEADKCTVGSLEPVCKCGKYSATKQAHLCNMCKDKTKWGYGCDLDCSNACGTGGCDLAGFCTENHCKRNSRISTHGDAIFNARGECAACERTWFGLNCEKQCNLPNCKDTVEGPCTRGGRCYECKDGWYGSDCNSPCPEGCKTCVMKDNMVPVAEGGTFGWIKAGFKDVTYMPAGACVDQCKKDTYGPRCDKPCSANCKKSRTPSCEKGTGDCFKCGNRDGRGEAKYAHQWWGPKCEFECGEGCKEGQCEKKDGKCEQGIEDGWWTDKGDTKCPEFTVGGCDSDTGLPVKCSGGRFPGFLDDGTPKCIGCGKNCLQGTCDSDGACNKGCSEGFWGKYCDKECSKGCAGACSQNTGACKSCNRGKTGRTCEKTCHKSCVTCFQTNWNGGSGSDKHHCNACADDQPTFLNVNSNTCDCIAGAERGTDGLCHCTEPTERGLEAFFVKTPKSCKKKCKEGLKAVYAHQSMICLENKVYKAAILAEDDYNAWVLEGKPRQGTCAEGEFSVANECLRTGFIENIVKER